MLARDPADEDTITAAVDSTARQYKELLANIVTITPLVDVDHWDSFIDCSREVNKGREYFKGSARWYSIWNQGALVVHAGSTKEADNPSASLVGPQHPSIPVNYKNLPKLRRKAIIEASSNNQEMQNEGVVNLPNSNARDPRRRVSAIAPPVAPFAVVRGNLVRSVGSKHPKDDVSARLYTGISADALHAHTARAEGPPPMDQNLNVSPIQRAMANRRPTRFNGGAGPSSRPNPQNNNSNEN